jgi:FAD binding domain
LLSPGDIGASSGLATNANAQLLDRNDQPIDGMYGCDHDMRSIMGGKYPGPGITLGPAVVFAYRAMPHCFGNEATGG